MEKLTSFEKVYASLLKTNEYAEWEKLACNILENAKMGEPEIALQAKWHNETKTTRERIYVSYIAQFGEVNITKDWNSWEGFNKFIISMGDVFGDAGLNTIVNKNFGQKHCPSYNCKKENIHKNWPGHARTHFRQTHKELIERTEARIKKECEIMKDSQDLKDKVQKFYERTVIDEIREVVLKYHDTVSSDVIKQALDEVICHSIMDKLKIDYSEINIMPKNHYEIESEIMRSRMFNSIFEKISGITCKDHGDFIRKDFHMPIAQHVDFFMNCTVVRAYISVYGSTPVPMIELKNGKNTRNVIFEPTHLMIRRYLYKVFYQLSYCNEIMNDIVSIVPDDIFAKLDGDAGKAYDVAKNNEKEKERIKGILDRKQEKKRLSAINSVRRMLELNKKFLDEEILTRIWREVQVAEVTESLKILQFSKNEYN